MNVIKRELNKASLKVTTSVTSFLRDKKASPGVEEAALLLFVGLVVANAANGLGTTINSAFAHVQTALENAIGI